MRRISRDEIYHKHYSEFLTEYESLGHMVWVSDNYRSGSAIGSWKGSRTLAHAASASKGLGVRTAVGTDSRKFGFILPFAPQSLGFRAQTQNLGWFLTDAVRLNRDSFLTTFRIRVQNYNGILRTCYSDQDSTNLSWCQILQGCFSNFGYIKTIGLSRKYSGSTQTGRRLHFISLR